MGGNMKKRMRFNVLLILLSILMLLITFGCSSKPSEAQAKAEYQDYLDKNWSNLLRVTKFQKVNGEGDSKKYILHWRAEIETLKDGEAYGKGSWHFTALSGFKWMSTPAGQDSSPRKILKGGVFSTKGKFTYRKTEQGWLR